MNKAVATNKESTSSASADAVAQRERLSALVDGQLGDAELADALAYACTGEAHATWEMYHLVGDVLRSPDLARPARPDFLDRLRTELSKEPQPMRAPSPAQPIAVPLEVAVRGAANASVFRWKMAAGVASLAAVAAIGWSSLTGFQGASSPAGGAQLAQSPAVVPSAPVVAVADADGQNVMIRDPRLDELLAAHKQFGGASALQMPAGFLRNATFETPGR